MRERGQRVETDARREGGIFDAQLGLRRNPAREALAVVAVHRDQRVPLFRLDRRVGEQHAVESRPMRVRLDHRVDEGRNRDLGGRASIELRERGNERALRSEQVTRREHREQRFLVREVLVERPHRDAGALGDRVGGRSRDAALLENASRGFQYCPHRFARTLLDGSFARVCAGPGAARARHRNARCRQRMVRPQSPRRARPHKESAMNPLSGPEPLRRAARLFDRDPAELAPRMRDGVLDLLSASFAPTLTQRIFDTGATAWLYDTLRDRVTGTIGMPDFRSEVRALEERLVLTTGDIVLDVACGQGNFSVELARRVGPEGLVVGLDIAAPMLARAARRVRRERLDNVLLVRGDALALPFRDGVFAKVNCSGGLHQMPDLGRALGEMARVAAPGARFTGSGFARADTEKETGLRGWLWRRGSLHFVPIVALGRAVEVAGFGDVGAQMAGRHMGYAWGRRTSA